MNMKLFVTTLTLGSRLKQRHEKVQVENAREFEGMSSHTPKWTPILGIGVPIEFRIFIEQFQGSKFIGLKISLYHWKALEM
jgi:hypothetical protein